MPKLKPKVHSYYDCPDDTGLECCDVSLTQQQFEEEANINNIIARYESTGILGDPFAVATAQPMYGDFSSVTDFHTAQNIIAHSMQAFEQLPAITRKYFENNPAKMLEFLEKEENRDEAIRLGLVQERTQSSSSNGSEPASSNVAPGQS